MPVRGHRADAADHHCARCRDSDGQRVPAGAPFSCARASAAFLTLFASAIDSNGFGLIHSFFLGDLGMRICICSLSHFGKNFVRFCFLLYFGKSFIRFLFYGFWNRNVFPQYFDDFSGIPFLSEAFICIVLVLIYLSMIGFYFFHKRLAFLPLFSCNSLCQLFTSSCQLCANG
ncbi:MAG: hypothetical protein LUH00_06320, partial [Lachnospiraceae bacterium]|nr:hypothetical protein [Lachnospiraceae bacterium]